MFLDEGHCTRFVPLHSDRKKNYTLFWIKHPTRIGTSWVHYPKDIFKKSCKILYKTTAGEVVA